MIVECYTADVYCDHPEHAYGDSGSMHDPATYTGKSKRFTDKARLKDGWIQVDGKDICPECQKRMKAKQGERR